MSEEVEQALAEMYDKYIVREALNKLGGIDYGLPTLTEDEFRESMLVRGMIRFDEVLNALEKGMTYVKDQNNGGA